MTPNQLKQLAVFMGLPEVKIRNSRVFYRKPGYEMPALYQPHLNPKQCQALMERISIGVRPDPGTSEWVASAYGYTWVSKRGDTIGNAVLATAIDYLEKKR